MSVLGAAAIGAGASLLGTAGSAVATGKLNKKTREWNEKMWHAQNAYNLPEAQMERFKQAGLNPNLIYGQGSSGNAGSPASWNPTAPDLSGIGGAVGKFFQTKIQQGQIERQRTENAILATDLESKKLDLDVKQKLTHVMVPDTDGINLSTQNMLYEGALAGLYEKRYRADRERVASYVDQQASEARISQVTHQALNEAARTGLINAQTANQLSQENLHKLDGIIKGYEAEFLQNFDLKHGDVSRMLMQSIPVLISKMFGK